MAFAQITSAAVQKQRISFIRLTPQTPIGDVLRTIQPSVHRHPEGMTAMQQLPFSLIVGMQHETGRLKIRFFLQGILLKGTKIGVKRLDRAGQGSGEFRAEVETLGYIHHVNLVKLESLCAEKSHRMLAYEYLPTPSYGLFSVLQTMAEEGRLKD
ncbi:G-type lectin S-receptor-like serine/threonine-protein kinase At2g19130 [Cryptomeria japonica]|uniref:G-type lectin S-receptor-like serine/threonine-protein kinase At2g19130 n=1 Tax=Cryptomeria japonica TaxID=3369 RepID=UPI0025AC02C6|nr:G-type lectin S-receptor-like serine/threonine-protein kinase At2g19130 [Cryptomeria japonica]